MVSVRLAALMVVAAALLAPLAAAAPTQGHLEAASIALPQGATLAADGIAYSFTGDQVPKLDLRADTLHVERIGTQVVYTQGPAGPAVVVTSRAIDTRADHGESSFYLSIGDGAQVVALRVTGPVTVALDDAALRPLASILHASPGPVLGPDQCRPPRCLGSTGVHEAAAPASQAELAGDLILLLRGPTLRVEGASGSVDYASGTTETRDGALVTQDDAWLIVTATGLRGTLESGPASWYSAAPRLEAPTAQFHDAKGALAVGALQYRANGDDVRATGALAITPDPVAEGASYGPEQGPLHAETLGATVAGDVASINLRAAPVFTDSPAEAAGILAILAAGAAGIAYYWPRLAFAAAAFYTRLKQPDILENDVRSNIYDIIRRNPGISARSVHRESGQSWGTVVYHLRQLERHHLVTSRTLGRTRNYYESQGKYRGMEVQLACLQSERALALARAILERPGITQEQLAEATGFPQPTTSYYVRKLKQAGLVEEQREGRYAKYLPHAELAKYVGHATVGTAAPLATVGDANGVS